LNLFSVHPAIIYSLFFLSVLSDEKLVRMIRSLLTSLLVGCLELVGSSLGAELDSATCLQLGFNPAKVKQEGYL
jgi:hypothetical protein